jgi:hypothetical protein
VGAALEGNDLKLRPLPTRLRRRAHAGRIATDDNKPLLSHSRRSSIGEDLTGLT